MPTGVMWDVDVGGSGTRGVFFGGDEASESSTLT